jgi:excisionase family DNA binding protein
MSKLLKVKGVCEELDVKPPTVYAAVKAGELPVVVVGKNHFRFDPADVERYKESRKRRDLVEAVSEKNSAAGKLGQQELQRRREVEAA